jgi:cell division protein FtsB
MPVVRPVTMMSGVLVILALLIAPYVRPYLAQRSQLAQGREDLVRLQREVDALQAERDRWNDPDYVKAQARARLHMVLPGEVGYVRLDPNPSGGAKTDPRSAAAAVPQRSGEAWYGTLWQSVHTAGTPSILAPAPSPLPSPSPSP